jgi:hypothetical protein
MAWEEKRYLWKKYIDAGGPWSGYWLAQEIMGVKNNK